MKKFSTFISKFFSVLLEYFIRLFTNSHAFPILSEVIILLTGEKAFFMLQVSVHRIDFPNFCLFGWCIVYTVLLDIVYYLRLFLCGSAFYSNHGLFRVRHRKRKKIRSRLRARRSGDWLSFWLLSQLPKRRVSQIVIQFILSNTLLLRIMGFLSIFNWAFVYSDPFIVSPGKGYLSCRKPSSVGKTAVLWDAVKETVCTYQ